MEADCPKVLLPDGEIRLELNSGYSDSAASAPGGKNAAKEVAKAGWRSLALDVLLLQGELVGVSLPFSWLIAIAISDRGVWLATSAVLGRTARPEAWL